MSKVTFSDVVRRANTKEDKDNTEKEFYVGGEHIDSSEALITKRGVIAGSTIGPMFYFGFTAGQVLLVSRNPHLRKAGIVTFDGICSEKTFVLESIDESILLQRYLPFVLQSDHFWSYAEANKSGSVNFFINWSTLAKYEFELPSIAKQKELSDLLWSINDTKWAYRNMIQKTDELVKSQFLKMFGDPRNNTKAYEIKTLKDVAVGSLSYGSSQAAVEYNGETRYIRITDITEEGTLNKEIKSATKTDEKYLLSEGDILFARTGATVGKTFRYQARYGRCIYAGFLIRLIPDKSKVLPEYVFHFTKSDYYNDFVSSTQRVVAQPNINAQEYGDLQLCVPPLELQEQFAEFVHQSDKTKFELEQSFAELTATYKKIISENLG